MLTNSLSLSLLFSFTSPPFVSSSLVVSSPFVLPFFRLPFAFILPECPFVLPSLLLFLPFSSSFRVMITFPSPLRLSSL